MVKRSLLLLLVLLLFCPKGWAEEGSSRPAPKLQVEWGLALGGGYWFYNTPTEVSDLKCAMGWQAGISTALVWGRWALQPEIRYARHRLDITPTPEADKIEVKSNAIEIPILLSWRPTERWRLLAGPMITALNSCKQQNDEGLTFDLGHVRPTIGYTVGVGFKLSKRLLIEARYVGNFSRVESVLWEGGPELKLKGNSLQLNLGVVFK